MDEKTLLEAMREMMKEELKPINTRLDKMDSRLDKMQEDITDIKEELYNVHGAVDAVIEYIENPDPKKKLGLG